MLGDVLQARIREYAPANAIEQENMLAELMQHYVLASLSRSGLFSAAMFHGGTCLRIFHSMNRFSEDLDFLLKQPDRRFAWEPHLKRIAADCESEGLRFEIQDKNQAVGPCLPHHRPDHDADAILRVRNQSARPAMPPLLSRDATGTTSFGM